MVFEVAVIALLLLAVFALVKIMDYSRRILIGLLELQIVLSELRMCPVSGQPQGDGDVVD